MKQFSMKPTGPFDLVYASTFFGGWLTLDEGKRVVISMPVEGWRGSATVVLSQDEDGTVHGTVYGDDALAETAWRQALGAFSLDADGSGWAAVGQRDPFIGKLQEEYKFLRPVLFHSPYEAAASLLIGHRISIVQRRAIMKRMAEAYGEKFMVEGKPYYAFPDPQKLLTITEFKGLNDVKVTRLHAAAQATLDGLLDRKYLRSLPIDDALTKLKALPGVGDFFAQGILYRGAGIVNDMTKDINTRQAVQAAYNLPELPDAASLATRATIWHPYEMWATVLLHVWMRREKGGFRMKR
ncbi:MAG TPA: hypothetical protein VLG11_05395 [Candidatus Saccharimonadales bacterium]|nr:hypothetical protein [Candidatus Saccharimonadales bacterium]